MPEEHDDRPGITGFVFTALAGVIIAIIYLVVTEPYRVKRLFSEFMTAIGIGP